MTKVTAPTLPQAFVSTLPSDTPTGGTWTVNAGCDLQLAINGMAAADPDLNHEIVLQAGATFTGNFDIPVKSALGTGWVTIRSSASASLPARGTRITAAHSAQMPKIVSPNLASPITINDSATRRKEGWRLLGIEAYFLPSVTSLIYAPIVGFGWGIDGGNQSTQAAIDVMQRRLAIERCYIHYSTTSQNQKVGVRIMGDDVQVRDSIITGQAQGAEGIAIELDAGAAILIQGNELRGAGQNIYFNCNRRDQDESIWSQTRPRDVVIRQNYLWKEPRWYSTDPAWDGLGWTQKPGIEIKYLGGLRVLIEGNTFYNIWSWGPIHLSTTHTTDVTIQHNRLSHCKSMLTVWDTSSDGSVTAPATGVRRVKVWNNLATDLLFVPNATGYDNGRWIQVLAATNATWGGQTSDIWIEHNTATGPDNSQGVGIAVTGAIDRLRVANNIFGYYLIRPGVWDGSDATIQNLMVITPGDGDIAANAMLKLYTGTPNRPYTQESWSPPFAAVGEWLIVGTPEEAAVGRNDGILGVGCVAIGAGVDFDNVADASDLGVNFTLLNAALGVAGSPDTTPPSVPTTLAHPEVNATSARVTWAASTDDSGIMGGYEVRRGGVVQGTAPASSTPTFTFTGLTASTLYSWDVRAFDGATPGNYSAFATADTFTTPAASAATPAPPDIMRGFGPTRGIGTSDTIVLPLTAQAPLRSYAFWYRRTSQGGGSAGRVLEKPAAEAIRMQGTSSMEFIRTRTAGNGLWRWSAPALDTPVFITITYDGSSTANAPIVTMDDVVQTVSLVAAPGGTLGVNANPYRLGNTTPASAYLDGDLARLVMYDFILSAAQKSDLYEGTDPLTIGAGPVAYHALDGTINEPDAVTTTDSTLVGTQVQVYVAQTLEISALAVTAGDPATGTDYEVTATVTGGTANRVEFWVDGILLTTDTTAPFILFGGTGGIIGPGTHTIEARVFPDAGLIPDDTATLSVTEPSANAGNWTVAHTWRRVTDAVTYNFTATIAGVDVIDGASITQPVTGDPQYVAIFSGGDGDVRVSYKVTAVFTGSVEGPPMTWRERYVVTPGSTVAIVAPTGHQELSRVYTP